MLAIAERHRPLCLTVTGLQAWPAALRQRRVAAVTGAWQTTAPEEAAVGGLSGAALTSTSLAVGYRAGGVGGGGSDASEALIRLCVHFYTMRQLRLNSFLHTSLADSTV